MICERSPTGMLNGKSREASMMAKKIHQPAMDVTNVKAPPACERDSCQRPATAILCVGRETYDDEFSSSFSSHCVCGILICEGQVPVCAREATESADEGEEDEEEDHVGAEGADEEDEADECYVHACQPLWVLRMKVGWNLTHP